MRPKSKEDIIFSSDHHEIKTHASHILHRKYIILLLLYIQSLKAGRDEKKRDF